MSTLILSIVLLLAQGIPVAPQKGGTITGVLKDSTGKPAVGIRMAAVPRPDSVEDLLVGTGAMSSIAETDAQGRYTLENVPPGRYYVAAGRLDLMTYYPGTQAIAEGRIIAVTAGGAVPGIDFALKDSSAGRTIGTTGGLPSTFMIPLELRTESGAKIPTFGGGKPTGVRLTHAASGTSIFAPVNEPYFPVAPGTAEYQVTVEGLPDGYTVSALRYGNSEIKDSTLRIAPAPPGTPSGQSVSVATRALGTTTGTTSNLQALLSALQGAPVQMPIPQTLFVTLKRAPVSTRSGVSVTGQFPPTIRGAFLSGVSFAIYVDHTFEFFGVQPGRYSLMAFGNAQKTYGASLVIGNEGVQGVELEETNGLPLNARTATPPGSAASRSPGRLPLAGVRGKILDAETGELVTRGEVFLVGDYWVGHPLTDDGSFEFDRLLPGKYALEVKAVGYATFRREFEIGEQDLSLDVKSN